MTKKQIPEETRVGILDAAWALMAETGRLDVGQAEIAARAGVSRQTVYLAFGSRAAASAGMRVCSRPHRSVAAGDPGSMARAIRHSSRA